MAGTDQLLRMIFTAEDRTRPAVVNLQRALRGLSSELKTFAAASGILGGLGTGAALGTLAANVFRVSDELNQLNKQTGIAVEDLSRLQFIAQQSDTEFSTLTTGITRLSRSMFDATNGSKDLSTLFSRLGVAVKDTEGNLRAPVDVLGDLADALSAIPDSATRAAVAQKLLGRAGAELLPFLAGGSKQIREFAQQSDRLGATLSGETVRAVDDFSDNMAALRASLTGLVATNMGPFIRDLADLTGLLVDARAGFGGSDGLAAQMKVFEEVFGVLTNPLKAITAGFNLLGRAARDSGKQVKESFGRANLRTGGDGLGLADLVSKETDQVMAAFKRQSAAFKAANAELQQAVSQRQALAESFQTLIEDINKPGETLATGTVVEPIRAIDNAKSALNEKDAEKAIRFAEQAREQLAALAESGGASKAFLTDLAKQAAEVADQAAQAQQAKASEQIDAVKARLNEIADLAKIKIDLNAADVDAQLTQLQAALQQRANENPIVLPVQLGRALSPQLDQIPNLQGKADGGLITGPGGPRSDSILARLSAGEYVVNAAAVARLGLPFMNSINRAHRYADGGLVADRTPASSPLGGLRDLGTLELAHASGLRGRVITTENFAEALMNVFGREATMRGRPLPPGR